MNVQCKWSKGNEIKDNGDIGQLAIDGNNITFHIDGYGDPFARIFVGKDSSHLYKVFTTGQSGGDSTGTLYHATKAFLYNGEDYMEFSGNKIEGISSFSFEIPEIVDWLKIRSVDFSVNDGVITIQENQIEPILIRESNPRIYLKYETNPPFLSSNDKIEMTLRNAPRIFIEYETKVDDEIVISHLRIIMRFFGLLIGKITSAEDIRLILKEDGLRMWLFVNKDFSYNNEILSTYRSRVNYDKIKEDLQDYFEKWFMFAEDEKYTYLQDVFFHFNGKRGSTVEDLFLTYCKFLEGYDLRVSNDEVKANVLKDRLDDLLKIDAIKSVLSPVFKEAGSSYKAKDVAKWISTGFIERVSLKDRIKRLDNKYLQILSANSLDVINSDDNEFYTKITKTRNYYSHYKQDNNGILGYAEMYRTLPLLEALIVIILLSEMGMSIDVIKEYMIRDEKYWMILSHHRPND
ncbi:HEPN domain-containing protein [Cohnella yongneupensis]|uniref:HEPN domain-containing protein n=1 Tax=Cohnella yongneupensis TaxID=425006 RepID=A0ABW0QUY7_9BACL